MQKDLINETKYLLKKYGLKANKKLGQNFIINQDVIDKIVLASEINKQDLIIEIGPGLGTLTKELLDKAKKIICIEIDKNMVEILENRFRLYNNIEIINEDILKLNLKELIKNEKSKGNIKNVKIVANLPYYITTPIIMKLLEEELDLESITVMVQKEVADRLIVNPGERNTGAITYAVYYYSTASKIVEVPNTSFLPEPEVESEVIKLNIRKEPVIDITNKELLFKIIKCAFMQRRKTLLNALTNTNVFRSKQEGKNILNKLDLDENIRPENLKLEDFAKILQNL